MADKLCIFVCQNFLAEIETIITTEEWQDVCVTAFPSLCGRPKITEGEILELLPQNCSHILLIGRVCIRDFPSESPDLPETQIVPVGQCFHIVAPPMLVDDYITHGGYLITPGWLNNWQQNLSIMGFHPDQAAHFFKDFAKELILLDTKINSNAQHHFSEFKSLVGIPAKRIVVGLDYARLMLSKYVLEWRQGCLRADSERKDALHLREHADHLATLDILTQMSRANSEAGAIHNIEDLFQMLFSPSTFFYLRVDREMSYPVGDINEEVRHSMDIFNDKYQWNKEKQGFMLSINSGDLVVGKLLIDRFAFPEHRYHYLNLALALSGVCGLAIENARNRKKLLEAEKMASMGVLVSGVAHEINTPLGVGITATSTLASHTTQLAKRFSDRTMTQSDLRNFLQMIENGTNLLASNLARISELVDRFRQVSVDNSPPVSKPFLICDCLNNSIQSLGDPFGENIDLRIHCDKKLMVHGHVGDWASIFINLINNSIRHGFRETQKGVIEIDIGASENVLKFTYQDDGKGMESEQQEKIFDPFFTGDIQQGMGLGMHLVYNLITQRMSGSIRCFSKPNEGTRYNIEVPL